MSNDDENTTPKKQLETARGGAGRKGKTAIGSGEGGDSDDFQSWPTGPELPSGFKPRTVICRRNDLIRLGLKAMLEPMALIVGEAADGMAGTNIIRSLRPDLVIVDVDLDVLNGVEVCRRTTQELPKTAILVFTNSYHATKYYHQLIRAGSRGICLICSNPRILFKGITHVLQNQEYCDPEIARLVKQTPDGNNSQWRQLTDSEIEVLIRLDLRNKEISEELDIKLRTVERHIESILAKLKMPTRTAAALKAVQMGFELLPKMPRRDPLTGVIEEHLLAEKYAEEAIRRQGTI